MRILLRNSLKERQVDVGMNSCFWDGYNRASDYIKRCCAVNTDSINVTDVAILCEADDLPWRAAKELFENQIEFNYLDYDLINDIEPDNGYLKIASNSYKILIKDGVTSDKADAVLQKFIKSGGIVIDYDRSPDLAGMIRQHSNTLINLQSVCDLRMTHIKKYDTDILFCVNEGEETVETVINEKVTAVLDAESGTVGGYYKSSRKAPLYLGSKEQTLVI